MSISKGRGQARSDKVSVIIPTRNRAAMLETTLLAIVAGEVWPLEIMVVDQSDEGKTSSWEAVKRVAEQVGAEATSETLADHPKDLGQTLIRYVRDPRRGVSNGRNAGIAAARGEVLLLTDDDTYGDARWVAEIEREYESDAQVVGVFGRLLPYGAGRADAAHEGAARKGIEVVRVGLERKEYVKRALPWHLGSGGNMSFRRQELLQIGGFDALLGPGAPMEGWSDLDAGYRLLAQGGGKIVYSPAPLAYHDNPKTFAEQLRTERGYGIGAGAACTKYARCGDRYAYHILSTWFMHMAVRRAGAGLFKWRNWQVVRLAWVQSWALLIGVKRALGRPIDRKTWRFAEG